MTHGQKTAEVIVFYHGFTSCPEQLRELGEQFFAQGYNIYIPRMPHHGHADQLSDALLATSSEELAAFATESIDIANDDIGYVAEKAEGDTGWLFPLGNKIGSLGYVEMFILNALYRCWRVARFLDWFRFPDKQIDQPGKQTRAVRQWLDILMIRAKYFVHHHQFPTDAASRKSSVASFWYHSSSPPKTCLALRGLRDLGGLPMSLISI